MGAQHNNEFVNIGHPLVYLRDSMGDLSRKTNLLKPCCAGLGGVGGVG
jgi:hypothetical protein